MIFKSACRLYINESKGSISIYIKAQMAKNITLPTLEDLLVEYDDEKEILTVKKL
jgi:hypothetical protein